MVSDRLAVLGDTLDEAYEMGFDGTEELLKEFMGLRDRRSDLKQALAEGGGE